MKIKVSIIITYIEYKNIIIQQIQNIANGFCD